MRMTLKKNILILMVVLLLLAVFTVSYTGAKYVYEEQYTFNVITVAPGYSFIFEEGIFSELQQVGVALKAWTSQINIYNSSVHTMTGITVDVNYTSTAKAKNSPMTLTLYDSSNTVITSKTINFIKGATNADTTAIFSPITLDSGNYVYATLTGSPNQPQFIVINSINIVVVYS